jgi:glycerophosphoryl diester phosphodiesterase
VTKDGHVVVNHDPTLKDTTNVEDFEYLFGNRMVDSITFMPFNNTYTDDYLIKDFTLAELKMLKRKQRYDYRNPYYNYEYDIQTLSETIELLINLNEHYPNTNKDTRVGLYIETKDYAYYKEEGIDICEMAINVLSQYGIDTVNGSEATLPIIF